ncbi:hypothetical protein MTO96_011895 [Rhipicephalus appendiculatus]
MQDNLIRTVGYIRATTHVAHTTGPVLKTCKERRLRWLHHSVAFTLRATCSPKSRQKMMAVLPRAARPDGARALISDVSTILEGRAQRARATVGVRDVGRQRSANGPPAESDPARRRKAPFRLRHWTPFPCCCWRAGSLKRPLFSRLPKKASLQNTAGICGPPAQ